VATWAFGLIIRGNFRRQKLLPCWRSLGALWTAIYPYPDRVAAVKKLLNLPEQVIPLNIIPSVTRANRKPRKTATTRPAASKLLVKSRALIY
jgi:hypothetical protein